MQKRQYHHGDLKNALIRAGTEILAKEGVAGLTLRKAAQRAGVSHSAPYAHFADKQLLMAAISTEGLRLVWSQIDQAIARHEGDPWGRLVAAGWATVQFALDQPDQYRVTFSGVLEHEANYTDYPEYLEVAHQSFAKLAGLVRDCQQAGIMAPGPADVAAVEIWALVHGLASLLIHRQVPRQILERTTARRLLVGSLAAHVLKAPPPVDVDEADRAPSRRKGRVARRPS